MKHGSASRPFIIILIVFLAIITLVGFARAAIIIVAEIDLDSGGQAYEVFIDMNGNLWVSDFGAGEIWHIDTDNKTYTIYGQLGSPSDAKIDVNGDLWWSDTENNQVGRLIPGQQEADMWSLTLNVSQTIGLAIESIGEIIALLPWSQKLRSLKSGN